MKQNSIDEAIKEAKRFIKIAGERNKKVKQVVYERGGTKYYYSAPIENGALRRVSMDLTRCLARMRRP